MAENRHFTNESPLIASPKVFTARTSFELGSTHCSGNAHPMVELYFQAYFMVFDNLRDSTY